MNQLQYFYQWIASTPSLFELRPPFVDFRHLEPISVPPLERYVGNPRLGFLYQHLCTTLIENTQRYSIEIDEVQINASSGQTLGAIDLILRNQEMNQFEHWEVAIKFYLLHQGIWYGPNAQDQLDKKLDRMLSHQLKMSKVDEFTQHYPHLGALLEHLLIQGRLYINPFSPETIPKECLGFELNSSQISGYWCYQHQWEQIQEPLYELKKPYWATGITDHTDINESDHVMKKPIDRFIHAQTVNGQFWFVVPDTWPN
ncbi:DUF1853 family protein [Vibrio kyushuensis]|uniref:DUF1853 family protein n=1 Tax=Vibrio kyushuensis TaxID=2910249 RepID=UPI003D0E769E